MYKRTFIILFIILVGFGLWVNILLTLTINLMKYIKPKLFHTTILDEHITTRKYKRNFTWEHDQDYTWNGICWPFDHEPTYFKTTRMKSFNKLEYRTCPEDWFMIKLYNVYDSCGISYIWHIYYPCYNRQNWYYSDNLTLVIEGG